MADGPAAGHARELADGVCVSDWGSGAYVGALCGLRGAEAVGVYCAEGGDVVF